MKKTLGIIFTLLIGFVLVSCKPKVEGLTNADILEAAKTQLSLGMTSEEMGAVNTDISLPTSTKVGDTEVTVSWVSSVPASVKVEGTKGTVFLGDADVKVELTATLKLEDLTETKKFEVTVSAKLKGENEYANLADLIDNAEKGQLVEVQSLVYVVGVGSDGYAITDGTAALKLFFAGGTPAGIEVGQKGHVVGEFDIAFGTTPQFKGTATNFNKVDGNATQAEIFALAKPRTVEEQVEAGKGEYSIKSENFGFFKFHAKLVKKTTAGNTNPYIASTVKDSKAELIHYYKIDRHDEFTAIADSGITKDGVDIYSFVNDYHSGDKIFRMGIYQVDVALDEAAKAGIDAVVAANQVKTLFYEDGKVTLSTDSIYSSTLTYSLVDSADSSILNLTTGDITVGADYKIVELKLTVKNGAATSEQIVKIGTGIPATTTDASAVGAAKGSPVKILGTVSDVKWDAGFKNGEATFTDSTGTLLVFRYPEKFKDLFVDGAKLEIVGIADEYNGKAQIKDIAFVAVK